MGRPRRVSSDEILDAAERVILKLGAVGLSIDAVAQEAGVSKSTVVYDHKSKNALLAALLTRQIDADTALVKQKVDEASGSPHPALYGRIEAATKMIDDTDRAVSLAVSASMASGEELQSIVREWSERDLASMGEGPDRKAALMAYLALSGFVYTELMGLHEWRDEERAEILSGIRSIYRSYKDME